MADLNFRPAKVELRSRRCTSEMIQHVISTVEEATSHTLEINESDKKQWKSRFREIYETSFKESVSIDGQDWTEVDDDTTEFEAVDLDKKEYINGELTNRLHEAVQEVALKRKYCPSKYKSSLSRLTTGELGRLCQVKVVCNNPTTEHISHPENVLSSGDALDRLKDTECTLSSLLKLSNTEVMKAKNLTQVLQYAPFKNKQTLKESPKKLRFLPRVHHTVKKPRTQLKLS